MQTVEIKKHAYGATELSEKSQSQYFGRDLEAMSFAENYHRWIIDEFRPFIGKNIIEVGAGSGNFSHLLLETGLKQLTAFEPSKNMFALLEQRFAKDTRVIPLNASFTPSLLKNALPFDSIVYVNVLEHIANDRKELKTCFETARSGSNLLIFVPAMPCLFSEFDRQLGHFRRYARAELEEKVNHAGFEIVKAHYFDMPGALVWYVNFKLLQQMLTANKVKLYDRLAVPLIKMTEKLFAPPAGKNVILVARKP